MLHGAEGLGAISSYLATLQFEAEPDYRHLRSCLQSILPGSSVVLAGAVPASNGAAWPPSAPAQPADPEPTILDTPLSPPDEDRGCDPGAAAGVAASQPAHPAASLGNAAATGAGPTQPQLEGTPASAAMPQRSGVKRGPLDSSWPTPPQRWPSPAVSAPAPEQVLNKRSRLGPHGAASGYHQPAALTKLCNGDCVPSGLSSSNASPKPDPAPAPPWQGDQRHQDLVLKGGLDQSPAAQGPKPRGNLDVDQLAMAVATGHISAEAAEVKERLRRLDPAEGLGIFAWVFLRLARDTAPDDSRQVRHRGRHVGLMASQRQGQ